MSARKLRVAVLFGGRSAEHEISVLSARFVLESLDRERFEPVLVGITKDGRWVRESEAALLAQSRDPRLAQVNAAEAAAELHLAAHPVVQASDASAQAALLGGEEGGRASMLQAESQITLHPQGSGTRVQYHSEVNVTGRLGRFALGMMRKQAQNLGEQFARNLQKALQSLMDTQGLVQDAPAPS